MLAGMRHREVRRCRAKFLKDHEYLTSKYQVRRAAFS